MDKYHSPKTHLNIFSLTHSSSSYSSSSFDTILVMFMHSFPLQSPSEATHFIPIAWQEHLPWKSRWWVVCRVHTFFSPTFPTRGYTFQSYCTAATFTMKIKVLSGLSSTTCPWKPKVSPSKYFIKMLLCFSE